MSLLADADRIVSMDEIDDYLEARGALDGGPVRTRVDGGETHRNLARASCALRDASRLGKPRRDRRAAILHCGGTGDINSRWSCALFFPTWMRDLMAQHGHSTGRMAIPGLSLLVAPIAL